MSESDHDPLWYDRVEPEEAPGALLLIAARFFVGLRAVLGLPEMLSELAVVACLRTVQRLTKP